MTKSNGLNTRWFIYHSIIYLLLSLSGAAVKPEEPTNIGRIDAVWETGNKIYIMEFKMGSEKEALEQIKEKKRRSIMKCTWGKARR